MMSYRYKYLLVIPFVFSFIKSNLADFNHNFIQTIRQADGELITKVHYEDVSAIQTSVGGYSLIQTRSRRALFPGTNWCGSGSTSKGFSDLGHNMAADRCCRDHDHCKHTIAPFTTKYRLFNYRFHTVSHCDCDESLCVDDPVAFTAIKAGRNEQYISFQAMVVNNNADFNPLYGVFKCTSPGIYSFSFTLMSPEKKNLRVSLRTNRIPVLTVYSGAANYNAVSGSTLIPLSEDDIVYLYIEQGEMYESNSVNRAFGSFSGFQVSETKAPGLLASLLGRNAIGGKDLETDYDDQIYEKLKTKS
ncbi:Acidic phospholipase A2 PA4 [Halotydeus destructor]|nr:Acidic phospholipase A2 PA4 [Halotydeus destructor]